MGCGSVIRVISKMMLALNQGCHSENSPFGKNPRPTKKIMIRLQPTLGILPAITMLLLVLISLPQTWAVGEAGPARIFPPLGQRVAPGQPINSFCYRPMHRLRQEKTCKPGFTQSNRYTCSLNCPIEYPTNCGFVCSSNQDSCAGIGLKLVGATGSAIMNLATGGLAEAIGRAMLEAAVPSSMCLYHIFTYMMEHREAARARSQDQDAEDEKDPTFNKLVAVASCMHIPAAKRWTEEFTTAMAKARPLFDKVKTALTRTAQTTQDPVQQFTELLKNTEIKSALKINLDAKMTAQLKEMMEGDKVCGVSVRVLVERIATSIAAKLQRNLKIDIDDLYEQMTASILMGQEVPAVAERCFPLPTDAEKRHQLINTIDLIMGGLIVEAFEDPDGRGKGKVLFRALRFGLDVFAIMDPTRISALISQLATTVCRQHPVTRVDDGTMKQRLALQVTGGFTTNDGKWTNAGDGRVIVRFTNLESKSVRLNIKVGGYDLEKHQIEIPDRNGIDAVEMASAIVITQKEGTLILPVEALQGKTLYFERDTSCWRKLGNFVMKRKKTSLLWWVPAPTGGRGHVELDVKILRRDGTDCPEDGPASPQVRPGTPQARPNNPTGSIPRPASGRGFRG